MTIRYWTLLLTALYFLYGCQSINSNHYDARVIAQYSGDNPNTFALVQDAINAAPKNLSHPYKIYIAPGNYYEKLSIAKANIQLIGAGIDKTRLYFDAYSGQESAPGQTWGTGRSGTLIINATDIQLHNLTIENSFDFVHNDALAKDHPQKIRNTQAVALHIAAGSDRVLVRKVKLLGYQDTLYVDSGRSWFDKTIIAGNVDFIFGASNALFTDSEIVTRIRGKEQQPHGYLVAPSTLIEQEFGLTFINCRLIREQGVPDNSTPLGRPWQPTTQFADGRYANPSAIGKAVFINSEMDSHITLDGWYSMSGTAKDGSKVPFPPEKARFFEFQSTGPGAKINANRRQLNADDAKKYTRENILGDWKVAN
jgi:pectinesterase